MSAITIIHQCRYLFCEILSFDPYPFREVPSFNPLHLFMCCLFFHLHSSVHLFPSHLLIVFLSNYISTVQKFSLFPPQLVLLNLSCFHLLHSSVPSVSLTLLTASILADARPFALSPALHPHLSLLSLP